MSSNDLEYYRRRVIRERDLAEAASDPKAAAAHAALADRNEALIAEDQPPTARILRPDFQKRSAEARRLYLSDVVESESQG